MNKSHIRIRIAKLTVLLVWISMAYHVPALIANESKKVEVLGRYSLWYFAILSIFITFLIAITFIGIWLVRSNQSGRLTQQFDSFFPAKQYYLLIGLISFGFIWFIINHYFFIPVRVTQSIYITLYISLLSFGLLFSPPTKLTERFQALITQEGITSIDVIILLSFALIAITIFIGFWRGINSFIFIGTDASNISSFIAGRNYPELFQKDALLDNLEKYRFYFTILMPIIRFIGDKAGNLGVGWAFLLAPHVFLQLLGFYWLGWSLFKNRYWAFLLSISSLAYFRTFVGNIWGIYYVIPRITFQVLLPYILSLVFIWRHHPKRWLWVMAMTGALVYVHPVSTPAWGLAIWLGYAFSMPSDWNTARRFKHLLLMGLVFLIVIMPFAIHYLSIHTHGEVTNYQEVLKAMEYRYDEGYFKLNVAFGDFLDTLIYETPSISLLGIIGLAVGLFLINDKESRSEFRIILGWVIGLLIVAAVIPLADHTIARSLEQLPLQLDLIRSLRYMFPILIILTIGGLWGISEKVNFNNQINWFPIERLVLIISLVWGFNWLYQHPIPHLGKAVTCWTRGEFYCPISEYKQDKIAILDEIRDNTPPGSSVLPAQMSLEVRYYSLRSVVFAYKDGGILGYSSPENLLNWYSNELNFQSIINEDDLEFRTEKFIQFARVLDADYALINWQAMPEVIKNNQAELFYHNDNFALIEIHNTASPQ